MFCKNCLVVVLKFDLPTASQRKNFIQIVFLYFNIYNKFDQKKKIFFRNSLTKPK